MITRSIDFFFDELDETEKFYKCCKQIRVKSDGWYYEIITHSDVDMCGPIDAIKLELALRPYYIYFVRSIAGDYWTIDSTLKGFSQKKFQIEHLAIRHLNKLIKEIEMISILDK